MSMLPDVVSDDEIQYMGSRHSALSSPTPFQSPVTGIVLHVAASHNEPEFSLTFHKSVAVVHIGRRPGSDPNDCEHGPGRALFRCAVVSRKHAKISFSDNGTIHLCDIGSHHGTHLRHAGEADSRMLEAGQPATVLDGDVITFGKPVGRNNETVRPVVVRVEVMTSAVKPLIVPTPLRRHGSGRYGLYPPIPPMPTSADSTSSSSSSPSSSSSSSDDSSHNNFDHSDHDSDIEEIPCPKGSPSTCSQAMTGSGIALRLFQRLLPPMRVLEKDDAAFWTHSHPITHPPQGPQPETSAPVVDLRSRSHSPMMLESPSGTPNPVLPPSSASAQPPSPPRTPEPAARPAEGPKASEEPELVSSIPLAQPGLPTSSAPATVQPSASFRRLFPLARPLPLSIPPHPLLATRSELKELKDAVNNMKDKLADPGDAFDALREKVALLEKRYAELHARSDEASKVIDECKHTVDEHQEQIVDLEDRIAELDSTHHELRDMHQELRDMKDVDEDTPMSNTSLHASLSEVREDIESLRRSFSERSASTDASTSSDALETKMKSLRVELESEASNMLTNLRTEWEEQKAQYMLHLQRTQNEAMQDIVLTSQREAAALVSLKRKRSLELEELDVDGAHGRPHPARSTLVATSDGVEVPSPKRKRVLAAVAHTATVMTLGAVTAWSVLAFT